MSQGDTSSSPRQCVSFVFVISNNMYSDLAILAVSILSRVLNASHFDHGRVSFPLVKM